MERILRAWAGTYYTEVILFILQIITLFISLKKKKLYPQLSFFPIYFLSFILLTTNGYLYYLVGSYPKFLFYTVEIIGNYLVTLIEFLTFLCYLHTIIISSSLKKITRLIGFISLAPFLIVFFQIIESPTNDIKEKINNLYLIESIALLIPCSFYFIELFITPTLNKLSSRPEFWISSGLMFYIVGTLPATVITDYYYAHNMTVYMNLFAVIYTFYILLFLMILKSYQCRKEKTILL